MKEGSYFWLPFSVNLIGSSAGLCALSEMLFAKVLRNLNEQEWENTVPNVGFVQERFTNVCVLSHLFLFFECPLAQVENGLD